MNGNGQDVSTACENKWSVDEVLEIGRDFQNEDKWHGAQWETAKLLCDTIEELQDRNNKLHEKLEKFKESEK